MRKIEAVKSRKSALNPVLFGLTLFLMVLIFFMMGNYGDAKSAAKAKAQTLSEIQTQIKEQEIKNKELQIVLQSNANSYETYVEEYARTELDFAKPGEKVFVIVGDDN